MSSTKLYGFSNYFSERVMPVDLPMHAQLSSPVSLALGILIPRPFLFSIPSSESQVPRASPPSPSSSVSSGSSLSSYTAGSGQHCKKKRVVFADAKGLALASVRTFIADPSETESNDLPQTDERTSSLMQFASPQTIAEHSSLKEIQVNLERCHVTERDLRGTVRVSNIKFDKTCHRVIVRITFDSWRSHQEVTCNYVREPQTSMDSNQFAFHVLLPCELNLKERLEFVVIFRSTNGNLQFMDNNKGNNYHVDIKVPELHLQTVGHARRSFILESPQRFSLWPGIRRHDPPRVKYPCRLPPHTESLYNKSRVRRTNVAPLC